MLHGKKRYFVAGLNEDFSHVKIGAFSAAPQIMVFIDSKMRIRVAASCVTITYIPIVMKRPSAPERLAYAVSARNRTRKYAAFLAAINPQPQETLLDVGANGTEYSETDNYLEKHYAYPEKLTVLTLDDPSELAKRYPQIRMYAAMAHSCHLTTTLSI
ncbi:MAG: hypothetical protein WDN67_03970 [Candidatus Moraniibacteriota bacterium]